MKTTGPSSQFAEQQMRNPSVKDLVRHIVDSRQHESERRLIKNLAAELNTSFLDCASALAYYIKTLAASENEPADFPGVSASNPVLSPKIRLVRYRLAVGHLHHATLAEIKKVLVEESGVDVKNIANVRIQDNFTLIDLPDEMPQEIFHHLKVVEINEQKLDITRVKNRSRVRNSRKSRQAKKGRPLQGAGSDSENPSGIKSTS